MILTEQEYNEIVQKCKYFINTNQFPDVCDCFIPNLDFDAFQSIFGQIYIKHLKRVTSTVERDIFAISKVIYHTSSTKFFDIDCF